MAILVVLVANHHHIDHSNDLETLDHVEEVSFQNACIHLQHQLLAVFLANQNLVDRHQ